MEHKHPPVRVVKRERADVEKVGQQCAHFKHLEEEQRAAGWAWTVETHDEFNDETLSLLRRRRAVSDTLQQALEYVPSRAEDGPTFAAPTEEALDMLRTPAILKEMANVAVKTCRFTEEDCGATPVSVQGSRT
jgi:hypothetical protein